MVATSLREFPYLLSPVSNVGPVTYRDASTFLEQLETIKNHLNTILVPDMNTALDSLWTDFHDAVDNAEQTVILTRDEWTQRWEDFKANIQLEIAALNDAAFGDMVLNEASETYAAISALIDTLAITATELDTALVPVNTAIGERIPTAEKGAANGVASLGADGKVPAGQLPPQADPITTLSGNYAARPLATAHPVGTTFYAKDVGETYRTTGMQWELVGNGGNELGYTTLDASVPLFNTDSTTYVDVPYVVLSVTAGERPFAVAFDLWAANSVPGVVTYAVFVDGVRYREFVFNLSSGDTWEMASGEVAIRGLTPGNTYSVSLKVKTTIGTSRTSGEPRIWAVNK